MTLKVDYIAVTDTDATNKYVQLSETPTDGTVAFDIVGGTAQAQVTDFAVDGTIVRWDSGSYNLYYDPIPTDSSLRMIYNR